MKTTITIIQRDNDNTDYLKSIVKLLNKHFTSPESMELRWELICFDVCQELNGRFVVVPVNSTHNWLEFDFSEVY